MDYRILTPQPEATVPTPGGHIRPSYLAIVHDDARGLDAVVRFDERRNQVRAGAAFGTPCYSDKAIDHVAEWMEPRSARATYDGMRRQAAEAADLAAELREDRPL